MKTNTEAAMLSKGDRVKNLTNQSMEHGVTIKSLFEVLILQTGVDQKLFWKLVFVAKKTNIEFK